MSSFIRSFLLTTVFWQVVTYLTALCSDDYRSGDGVFHVKERRPDGIHVHVHVYPTKKRATGRLVGDYSYGRI